MNLEDYKAKVAFAIQLITEALEKHGNRIYVAYSGGKDSKALLKMVRKVQLNVLVVHNRHEGEVCDIEGVLVINGPKKANVVKALSYLEIEAQLDGTRQDEDDYVMIDGVDVHRSNMDRDVTDGGVWGLRVYFPLRHFTEEEVYHYLNN